MMVPLKVCRSNSFLVVRPAIKLVEARRVELLSENSFLNLSPSAVDYLNFPKITDNQQPVKFGSPLIYGRIQDYFLLTFTAIRRSASRSQYSGRERAALRLLMQHY